MEDCIWCQGLNRGELTACTASTLPHPSGISLAFRNIHFTPPMSATSDHRLPATFMVGDLGSPGNLSFYSLFPGNQEASQPESDSLPSAWRKPKSPLTKQTQDLIAHLATPFKTCLLPRHKPSAVSLHTLGQLWSWGHSLALPSQRVF